MQDRLFLFTIGKLPVYAHPTYLFLVVYYLTAYRWEPPAQMLALGFIFAVGVTVSILLHEWAHAVVARWVGVEPLAIEINGCGGLAYLSGEPRQAWASVAISLAGPCANLALYGLGLAAVAGLDFYEGDADFVPDRVYLALNSFVYANGFMFLFNLLPAFPLDGGRAAHRILGSYVSEATASDVIAVLGMAMGGFGLVLSHFWGYWFTYMGIVLIMRNWEVFEANR